MSSNKRKRETHTDRPRIAFHTSDRSWERILQEESLAELQDVVARRLGLPSASAVRMWHLTDGRKYELFEDDDFDAFYSSLLEKRTMHVEIQVVNTPRSVLGSRQTLDVPPQPDEDVQQQGPPTKRRKSNSKPRVSFNEPDGSSADQDQQDPTVDEHSVPSEETAPAVDEQPVEPQVKKKRRKKSRLTAGVSTDNPDEDHRDFTEELASAIQTASSANHASGSIAVDDATSQQVVPVKKKRGRPKKSQPQPDDGATLEEADTGRTEIAEDGSDAAVPAAHPDLYLVQVDETAHPSVALKRNRGRPPKTPHPQLQEAIIPPSDETDLAQANEVNGGSSSTPLEEEGSEAAFAQKIQKKRRKSRGLTPSSDTEGEDQPNSSRPKRNAQKLQKKLSAINAQQDREDPKQETKKRKKQKKSKDEAAPSPDVNVTVPSASAPPSSAKVGPPRGQLKSSAPAPVDSKENCPVCLSPSSHLRYRCPVIMQGPTAIRDRIKELEGSTSDRDNSILTELREILQRIQSSPSDQAQIISQLPDSSLLPRQTAKLPAPIDLAELTRNSYQAYLAIDSDNEDEEPRATLEEDDDVRLPRRRERPSRVRRARHSSPEDEPDEDDDETRTFSLGPPRISVIARNSEAPSDVGLASFATLNHDNASERMDDPDSDAASLALGPELRDPRQGSVSPTAKAVNSQEPTVDQQATTRIAEPLTFVAAESEIGTPPPFEPNDRDPIQPASQPNSHTYSAKSDLPPPSSPQKRIAKNMKGSQVRSDETKPPSRKRHSPFAIAMPPPADSSRRSDVAISRGPTPVVEQSAVHQDDIVSSRASQDVSQGPSLVQWTTLPGTTVSEHDDTQSVGQFDELQPSSSPDLRGHSRQLAPSSPAPAFPAQDPETPLFLPGSQSQHSPLIRSSISARIRPAPSRSRTNSAEEEKEVEKSIQGLSQLSNTTRGPRPSLPPSLSQLRGRSFAAARLTVPPQASQDKSRVDLYGRKKAYNFGSDSDDSELSDSEEEGSHIPKGRRAGGLTRNK